MQIKIVTAGKMREIEAAANAGGLSYARMMETAGKQVVEAVDEWMGMQGMDVLVLVGPGNNGGDGLVAACHLQERAASVRVYIWGRKSDNGDENWRQVEALGIPIQRAEDDAGLGQLRHWLAQVDMIVDALLGTGARHPLQPELAALMDVVGEAVRQRRRPVDAPLCAPADGLAVTGGPIVVAVDLPSGLEADTGTGDAHMVPADLTVTFAAAKWGQLVADGPQVVGKLVVADIGIPESLLQDVCCELVTAATATQWLPRRSATAGNESFGRVLVVAGSANEPGAATLAAMAAARAGAGGVTVGLPQAIYPLVAPRMPEARFLLLPHDMGAVTVAAEKVLRPEMPKFQACLLGPGLGTEKVTQAWLHRLLGETTPADLRRVGFRHGGLGEGSPAPAPGGLPPLVLDADSTLLLRDVEDWWQRLPAGTILIVNARVLAEMSEDAPASRPERVTELADKWGHVVVLTGAFTMVAAPGGRVGVLPFANPALATAGSGHVLAGAIAGVRAQGLAAYESALLGGYLHGLAGELARNELHQAGVLASDLLPLLPRAAGRLQGSVS